MTDTTIAEANPDGSISVEEAASRLFDEAPVEGQAESQEPAVEVEATNADADDAGMDLEEIDRILSPDSDDGDQEPADDPSEALHRVTVQGEELEITTAEALAGYQRNKDYSIKTAELSQQRRQLEQMQQQIEAEKAQNAQMREGMSQRLGELDQQLSQTVQDPGAEYWEQLYESDPLAYMKQREQFRDFREQQQTLAQERALLARREQQEAVSNHRRVLAQEQQVMVQRIPSWSKDEVRTREMAGVKSHLMEMGYTEQEIDGVVDSRAVKVAYDSWLLSQLKSQTSKARAKTSKAPKMVTTSRSRSPQTGQQKAEKGLRAAFNKSGSVQDALAILNSRS
jgi:hypothetical protein